MHEKKPHKKWRKTFLILQYSILKSIVVQYSWHPGADIEWTGKKSYWLEEGGDVGGGRAEGSSTIGGGKHTGIFESSQLEGP